ncbi:MAG: phosphoglycolate phosphatase [Alteromonadaceae bacterium]|jgi:phosphoglycolate phosphatase
MKYKLVIFDWDGTLMDSVGRIVSSMQSAARLSGVGEPNEPQVKNIIGLSLAHAIDTLFPQSHQAVQQSIFGHYKDQYVNHDQTPAPLFDGAVQLLSDLKLSGYKLAVATGKGRQGLERVWMTSQTGGFFDSSRCADEAKSKPSPDMLEQLLKEMRLDVNEAVMIGDSEFDMAMAKAINMDRIGVSYGVHSRERLLTQTPLTVVDQISELRKWI